MAPRFLLRAPHRRRIREIVEAAWPLEACGLLEGTAAGHDAVHVVHALPNVHAEPQRRFTIDPEAWLYLEHAASSRGRIILGVWHSHPHGDPSPSDLDREQAWPGWSYLIAGVTNAGMIDLRCWRIDGTGCHEQVIVTEDP